MADSRLRELERRARAGDADAEKRLGLAACGRGEHLPPGHGDDQPWDVLAIATASGSKLLRTWTCPRCWEVVEAIDPAWCTPEFWREREAWRAEKFRGVAPHVDGCAACQAYDTPEGLVGPAPACYPNTSWRYDGRTEIHRRAVAGLAP